MISPAGCTYSENSRGPNTLHYGIPEESSELHEAYSFIEIFEIGLLNKISPISVHRPLFHTDHTVFLTKCHDLLCQMLLRDQSWLVQYPFFYQNANLISSPTHTNEVSVEWHDLYAEWYNSDIAKVYFCIRFAITFSRTFENCGRLLTGL